MTTSALLKPSYASITYQWDHEKYDSVVQADVDTISQEVIQGIKDHIISAKNYSSRLCTKHGISNIEAYLLNVQQDDDSKESPTTLIAIEKASPIVQAIIQKVISTFLKHSHWNREEIKIASLVFGIQQVYKEVKNLKPLAYRRQRKLLFKDYLFGLVIDGKYWVNLKSDSSEEEGMQHLIDKINECIAAQERNVEVCDLKKYRLKKEKVKYLQVFLNCLKNSSVWIKKEQPDLILSSKRSCLPNRGLRWKWNRQYRSTSQSNLLSEG